MSAPVTGRFAPTPSGRLHLGNLLCAMLAYLSARSAGGRFLLRIEDLDVPRCPARLSRQCIEDLTFLGFDWDEPPVFQSERTPAYERALSRLRDQGLIYPCFCTRAQLHEAAPNEGDTQFVYGGACRNLTAQEAAVRALSRSPALRMRVPEEVFRLTDGLCGAIEENLARDCGDFVVRRSDGLFGYQLAVVVDDAESGVTEVVRGRDILSSTPRQLFLQRALGLPQPRYVHIPLLRDEQGRRLAKRDGDIGLEALSKRFTPQEILGLLAASCGLLEEAVPVTLAGLIPLFSWEKVAKKGGDFCLPDIVRRGL